MGHLPSGPAIEPRDEELELIQYALVLWRRRWLLLAATVLFACVAAGLSVRSQPMYEAAVKLVAPSRTGNALDGPMPPIPIATLQSLIQNRALAAQVITELKLDGPPMHLTPTQFLAGHLSVENVPNTNMLVMTVRLANRELAATTANRLAALATELSGRISQEETAKARDVIKAQADQAQARLREVANQRDAFRKQAQIEALQTDVDAVLGKRGELLQLLVDIQSERAHLTTAEQQLEERRRVGSTARAADADAGTTGATERLSGQSAVETQTRGQYARESNRSLEDEVALGRATLAALEKQKSELIDVRRLNASQLALLNQLYERQAEMERLDMEYDLARDLYINVATRHEQAQIQANARSAQLQTIEPATLPDQPLSRHVVRNTVVAAMLGFLLAAIVALLLNAVATITGRGTPFVPSV